MGPPKLTTLYFYFTSYCNLRCAHCWIDPTYTDAVCAPAEADFDALQNIVDQALPLGLRSIKITGGEPFLSKHVFALIECASKRSLNVNIETNGTLITEEAARTLGQHRVNQVAISLDGPDQRVHENLRNQEGSFEQTLRGIRECVKNGLKVQAIFSLYKDNADYLEDVIVLAQNIGVTSLKINRVSDVGRGKSLKTGGLGLPIQDYIALSRKVETEIQPRYAMKIIPDIPPAFKQLETIRQERCVCGIKSILGVLPDGSVSICGIGQVVPALRLGDPRQTPLEEIWRTNHILKQLRTDLPFKLKGSCARCVLKGFCLGKCRAESYYNSADLFAPFSFCEEAFHLGLFPKDRMF
jgi:SynChlorMet cassette radical SAM/SPASM protein ScmF